MKRAHLIFIASLACWAGPRWAEVRTGRFQVLTDAGEKTGREAASRFEQIRRVMGPARESPLPVRVYVFSSPAGFRPFRTGEATRGFYQSGPDRDFIAMEHAGSETYRVVYHEYVHLVLNHSSAKLPLWFEEGIAEFYSTLDASGDKLRVGKPVPQHVSTLLREKWLGAGQLAAMHKDSPMYREGVRSGVLYAQSWALVHLLYTSPSYRMNLDRFAELIADTVPAAEAFPQAFGRTMEEALEDLRVVVAARRFPVAEIQWRPGPDLDPAVRRLTDEEAELARAELFLAVSRPQEALKVYELLARGNPRQPLVQEGLGRILLAQNRRSEAMAHFQRALELGARNADLFFEIAMLLRESGAVKEQVASYLRKAVDTNPHHAEALFLLGNMALLERRLEESIEFLRRATGVLPRQSHFWQALALAYHQKGEKELAARSARRALDSAETPQEEESARAALRLASVQAPPRPQPRPEVVTPESWLNRKGDTVLEGHLVEVECREEGARFHVLKDGKRHVLLALRPNEIVLRNSRGVTRELPCGRLGRVPVKVEYVSATKEVVAIQFP